MQYQRLEVYKSSVVNCRQSKIHVQYNKEKLGSKEGNCNLQSGKLHVVDILFLRVKKYFMVLHLGETI